MGGGLVDLELIIRVMIVRCDMRASTEQEQPEGKERATRPGEMRWKVRPRGLLTRGLSPPLAGHGRRHGALCEVPMIFSRGQQASSLFCLPRSKHCNGLEPPTSRNHDDASGAKQSTAAQSSSITIHDSRDPRHGLSHARPRPSCAFHQVFQSDSSRSWLARHQSNRKCNSGDRQSGTNRPKLVALARSLPVPSCCAWASS